MKYKVGDLIYYYDGDDSEDGEESIGTIVAHRMQKQFPNDPDGSEMLHYKVEWADGYNDGNDNYIPEDVVDEYSDALNEALSEK